MGRRKILLACTLFGSMMLANMFLCSTIFDPWRIYAIEQMPNAPNRYVIRDWKQVTMDFDAFVFNQSATGDFLPVIQVVNDTGQMTFNMPAYVGRVPGDEAVVCLAAVLSASLVGIDKTNQDGINWVQMCDAWWSSPGIYVNNRHCITGQSFWYEILPTLLIYQIAACYPQVTYFDAHIQQVAETWYAACQVLNGDDAHPDFNHLAFNFTSMQPVDNGKWIEPDAAAGVAWLEYMAYLDSGEARFLTTALQCLNALCAQPFNPLYEILLPYGAILAARLNAERGYAFDVPKLVTWCFGPSHARGGWGVIKNPWYGYDVHGLHGDLDDGRGGGGYAFAMNTFQNLGILLPLARYEDRYARSIGKFALNAAANARYFYGDAWDAVHQDSEDWIAQHDPRHCLAYEALRRQAWDGQPGPFATGDLNRDRYLNETGRTNLALYGGAHVGLLGGAVATTNVEKILQFDLLKTDFYHEDTYPCYLYYNPHATPQAIEIDVGSQPVDLYDSVSNRFLIQDQKDIVSVMLPADDACVLHVVPSGASMMVTDNHLLINGKVVDYAA